MADRDGRSRLSAFAAGNMPAPEPDRLGMLAESGQRRSSNVEDMAHIQMLEPRYLAVADLPGVADTASIGLRRMARPWRYRDISDVLGEISSLLPTQRIPPMPSLPAAPRTAGYALGGDVDPDATRGDMRDREDAVAFYVTPAQARTLADAGLIQSGAWGSPEALDRANLRQDMTDADRARAWRETGWAIHHGQPRTWVDAPLGLSPRHAAPFSRGEFVGGSLDDVLSGRGVDVMRALGLGDLPIEIRKGSEAMGGTRQYSDTGKAARIFGVAPDRSSLSDLLNHEGQHAVDMAEHPIEDPYANPIAGTRAENIFRAASGRTLPSGISADDMAQSAPETASYLRSSHEDRARDNTIRQRDPKRFRNVPPGQIDTYSEDAWPGRRFDGAFGVKLRDYDPNRRFASGGSVDDVLSRYSEPVRTWPGEDTWDRDEVLPFARRVTSLPITGPDQWVSPEDVMRSIDARSGNKWQFAWPRMATDVADAAKAVAADSGTSITPMRAPSDYSPEEMEQFIAHGMAGAMTGVTGGLARVALAPRLPHGEFELGSSGSRLGSSGSQMNMRAAVPRAIDDLGYYSPTLESALNLRQAKGTPEQMLAQMKSAGARDAEIEATGLKAAIDGKKSITRDEIISHLEGNRIGLREARYGLEDGVVPFKDLYGNTQFRDDAGHKYFDLSEVSNAKWQSYSLDPSNPTYRETVLHLPDEFQRISAAYEKAAQELQAKYGTQTPGEALNRATPEERTAIERLRDRGNNAAEPFRSGHFPEPNIIGHMMTSMTTHEGRPVFTIDQIQSDWGQKLRDGGVRDEAKIAELKSRIEEMSREIDPVYERLQEANNPRGKRMPYDEFKALNDQYDRLAGPRNLLAAELRTAEASSPGHPLVNTTDQWVNTTLRRAIRQAAEANADYIAIPSGDTVLSYNPGDANGMHQFYGRTSPRHEFDIGDDLEPKPGKVSREPIEGIVPKNLRKLLQRIDKNTPAPEHIETLDSPSGKTGLGKGFTVIPLTHKVKQSVLREGQPLFSTFPIPGTVFAEPGRPQSVDDILDLYKD